MTRLANASETFATLRLAGGGRAVAGLERYLPCAAAGTRRFFSLSGSRASSAQVEAMRMQAGARAAPAAARFRPDRCIARKWRASRFRSAYLRNALWSAGYAVDTMETAVDWPRVRATMQAIETAGRDALARLGEKCHAQTHLSHVYPQGSSVYSTFLFRVGPDFETSLERWREAQGRGQRGDRAPRAERSPISTGWARIIPRYLSAEKGERGLGALRAMVGHFDPGRRPRLRQSPARARRNEPRPTVWRGCGTGRRSTR